MSVYEQPTDPAKRRSAALTEGWERAPARSMLKAVGFTDDDLAKPLIGVATTWIETMPCNLNQRVLAKHVKDGIRAAGGTPIEVNSAQIPQLQLQPGSDLINLQTGRVNPWSIFGFSGGVDLRRDTRVVISAQMDMQNIFNTRFVYNFGNPFSGTHFGCPRLWSGRLKFTFR